jgi:nicotinamidase-related amidase
VTSLPLITPSECALVLVDVQAGLMFAAGSADRQIIRDAVLAVAKTAAAFSVPVVASTSASKVYSGPLIPPLRAALTDVLPIERRSMNLWEDDAAKAAVLATGRRTLIVAGLLTEACVSFLVLSALAEGYRVLVVADACGGLTHDSHQAALHRMQQAGAVPTSWLQVLLEFQRDWTRREIYEAARAIVVEHGGGYGIGLDYARDMIKPA